ncbi:hypothetical protein Sjap_004093 [Stephania japonica]|uniref:Uncharacterized protein n=1 Tax=Stephania japonica TaxID=461633 RepID=A0AAP0PJZ7_9MAGN
MDFHSLARRELQTLCKKNKIPANMTNVAMADALAALANVEGIEEIEIGRVESGSEKPELVMNTPYNGGRTSMRRRIAKENAAIPIESDQPSRSRTRRIIIQDEEQEVKDNKDEMSDIGSNSMPPSPKTGLRSSTHRRPMRNQKAVGEENLESSKPATRTQCRMRKTKQEDEQENENTNLIENLSREAIPKTPATCNGRRRAAGNSVVKAQQDEIKKQDLIVSQVCSTRRSTRLQLKACETVRKERRTESVQIAALSEEENEEVSEKSTSMVEGMDGVSSGENATAKDQISAKGSCNPDIQEIQEDSIEKDAPTAALSDEVSNLIPSDTVTDLAIEEDSTFGNLSEAVVSIEILEDVASLHLENFSGERTINPERSESDAEDSLAVENCLVEEFTENDTQKSAKHVVENESSEAVEFTNSLKETLSLDLGHIEDLDTLLSEPFDGYQSDDAQSAADINESSGISKDQETEELDHDGKEASTYAENTGNTEGGNDDKIELQVEIKEGLHVGAIGETPLPEIWDFAQECLNSMKEENSNSESVPIDVDLTGEVESVDTTYCSDFYSIDNTELLHCHTHEAVIDEFKAAQSIEEPSYEKMVVSDMELENFGSNVVDDANSDATAATLNSTAMVTNESCEKTGAEHPHVDATKIIGGSNVHESSPILSSFVVLSDVVSSLYATTGSIPNQVPSCLSPCSGLASESGKSLNQFNVTPTGSSMKKKSTPSQKKATIMVFDENIDGKYSGGTSLKKKSNTKALASAGEGNENKENLSGGLGLRNKSNSKVTISVAEEKENGKLEDSIQRTMKSTSLRQLKKLIKNKLKVVESNVDKGNQQSENTRAALQTLTENTLTGSRED